MKLRFMLYRHEPLLGTNGRFVGIFDCLEDLMRNIDRTCEADPDGLVRWTVSRVAAERFEREEAT